MAKDRQAELARKNLDKRLAPLDSVELARPRGGWVRAIRDALGMSTRQLASRMNVAHSRIAALEKAETTGATTLKSLREAAEALGCEFVYAFVPTKPLGILVRDRARQKAHAQFASIAQGMLLENQSLTAAQKDEEIERLTDQILAEPIRRLWEDE
ncbi:MAG TPA: mobile mystery protein A [Novosphingobium sp.]|nr:mobile mystery protein A [Novosphingobium sp.]